MVISSSIHIVDVGSLSGTASGTSGSTGEVTGHAWHSTGSTSGLLVDSHHNGVEQVLQGLMFLVELLSLGILVALQPLLGLLDQLLDLLSLIGLEFILELLIL